MQPQLAAVDSGCSAHTIRQDAHVASKTPLTVPKICGTPTGHTMSSNMSAILDIPNMPQQAKLAHIYPNLRYRSLISVGQLCDAGYEVTFDKNTVSVVNQNTHAVDLQGFRDRKSGLYLTPLKREPQPDNTIQPSVANTVYKMRTQSDLAQYLHRACWSPVTSTWITAINAGHYATFPGLTTDLVNKHLPKSPNTYKGHAKRHRQHVRSTQSSPKMTADLTKQPSARTNLVTFGTRDVTGEIATDQTGKFPVKSSKGNQYIMVAYVRDPNVIMAQPIKNRTEKELVNGYSTLYERLKQKGLTPLLQICDNECPAAFKNFLTNKGLTLQLAPPYDHRTNPAEKAIDTFKAHFIAGLASVDPQFPLHLWCRMLPHAELTLNLNRASNVHPQLSAHAHLNGVYDYNAHPIAPPGCKVVVYEGPNQRGSWQDHGVDGWYIGPSHHHYRCHIVYVPKSRATRIADGSTEFFPHDIAVPKTDPRDNATRAALQLAEALKIRNDALPYETPGDKQMEAINKLAEIFGQITSPPVEHEKAQLPRVGSSMKTKTTPQVEPAPPQVVKQQVILRTPTPRNNPQPHVIPLDEDETTEQRYPLRSRIAATVTNTDTGAEEGYTALSKGTNAGVWIKAYADDLGMLAQGIRDIKGTNTVTFIPHYKVPPNKKVTYGKKEVSIRPNKEKMYRVRLTVGGDKLTFLGVTKTQCASLTTLKILLNSTISTKGARFATIDIKNFYYGTPMPDYEYMKIPYKEIPEEIINQYELNKIEHNGYIYLEIRKGMPGLKQAGNIANQRLTKHLAKFGYTPVEHTPSLWKHNTRPIMFTLVVDDFGVKYQGIEHFRHLHTALQLQYDTTVDMTGNKYLGLSINWNYEKQHVDISMPNYIKKALLRFTHQYSHSRKQHAPHQWNKPQYGQRGPQYVDDDTTETALPADGKKLIQQIVGTLLYYALAVDATLLVALGSIASQQSKPTERTMSEVTWLLDYCATHPEATIRYNASGMVLWTDSDASYLSESQARSRAGGFHFLSDAPDNNPPREDPPKNGLIHALATIIKAVVGSAMEAEIAAAYENAKQACPIRITLEEMGHPQPPTPMKVDSATAVAFANDTMKFKRTKSIDMKFFWLRDREAKNQFTIYWRPGSSNECADYFTKHHSPAHHQKMRSRIFVTEAEHSANALISCLLQGCDKSHRFPRSKLRK